jgi:hypothetical protein
VIASHELALAGGILKLFINEKRDILRFVYHGCEAQPEERDAVLAWLVPILAPYRDDPRPHEVIDQNGTVDFMRFLGDGLVNFERSALPRFDA